MPAFNIYIYCHDPPLGLDVFALKNCRLRQLIACSSSSLMDIPSSRAAFSQYRSRSVFVWHVRLINEILLILTSSNCFPRRYDSGIPLAKFLNVSVSMPLRQIELKGCLDFASLPILWDGAATPLMQVGH